MKFILSTLLVENQYRPSFAILLRIITNLEQKNNIYILGICYKYYWLVLIIWQYFSQPDYHCSSISQAFSKQLYFTRYRYMALITTISSTQLYHNYIYLIILSVPGRLRLWSSGLLVSWHAGGQCSNYCSGLFFHIFLNL